MNGQFTSKHSENIYFSIVKNLKKECNKSTSNLLIKTAKFLIDTPYKSGTLEGEEEILRVNLQETDCIIFTETCLAIAINAHNKIFLPDSLFSTLKRLRYRNGIINSYKSRLHYTSEWILQGEKNGYFKDISKDIGNNTVVENKINFISSNPNCYKYLQDNPNEIKDFIEIENNLNKNTFYYIPKKNVPEILNKLKSGDIVCFNTTIKGLDISHVGIIYKEKGKTTFIHASSKAKKVIIEPKGLVNYINDIKTNNGIRILRITN